MYCNSIEDIYENLEQLSHLTTKELQKIAVQVPHKLLENGLIISDTPGFGASNLSDEDEKEIMKYLQESVSQVFWVVLAEQGITKKEKKFHNEFFADICNDIVVTGCEDWDDRDKLRFKKRYAKPFNRYMLQFHFVSGLDALKAQKENNEVLLEQAGIKVLQERIQELANPTQRIEVFRNTLKNICFELKRCFNDIWTEHKYSSPWWREDSWKRFLSSLSNIQDGKSLAKNLYQES